jgi:hypothetical protein
MSTLETWPWPNVEPVGSQHELWSIAASLKRIADMAEKDREPVLSMAPDPNPEPTLIERQRAEMIEIDRRSADALERLASALEMRP